MTVDADLPAGGGIQAQDRAPGGGLAAAALADQAQRLAALDVEGDAIHGTHCARPCCAG